MAIWTAVAKQTGTVLTNAIDIVAVQTRGFFVWAGSVGGGDGVQDYDTEYTVDEMVVNMDHRGFFSDLVSGTDSIWMVVSKTTDTSWTQVVQSGTVEAQFELNEPLGGPVWTPVTKDS